MKTRDRTEYMREYQKRRYHKRRQKALELLGGKCVCCGSGDDLEIDHINHQDKTLELNKSWGVSKSRYWDEIKKCQLLCKDCHIDKTVDQLYGGYTEHGSLTMYTHHECRCSDCKNTWNEYHEKYQK